MRNPRETPLTCRLLSQFLERFGEFARTRQEWLRRLDGPLGFGAFAFVQRLLAGGQQPTQTTV